MTTKFAPLTIGADPEFFIQSRGTPLPIIGLLGGTKDAPLPVNGAPGFAMQEDNVMAEYNIPAFPSHDSAAFSDAIRTGRSLCIDAVSQKVPGVEVYPGCVAHFPTAQLRHPQAQTFGCSPDFDGYTQGTPLGRIMPRALETDDGAYRFAGGHVHIGYTADTFGWLPPPFVVATMCDVFLSVTLLAHGYDQQGERRKFYGTPGRYRPTKYGIEYRTLGNGWTMDRYSSALVADTVTQLGYEFRKGEERIRQLYNDLPWIDIRSAISRENMRECSDLRNYFRTLKMEVY